MAPEIIDLTVSPPSSPTNRHRPVPSSSAAAAMPNQHRRLAQLPRYDYKRFILTEREQRRPTEQTATTTAGPSSFRSDSNVHGSGTQNMQQGGQTPPIYDIEWTEKDHQLFVEGIAKCGMGNWHRMAEKFVKTKTPQQICNYAVEYFRRVRSTSLRATRYIEAKSRSTATSVGPSNKMDIMINVAPRAKNPASKRLRKLVSRGLGGIHNPRWWTIGSYRSKKLAQGSSLRMPMESALGQQPVPVSGPSVVPVPVSAPAAVPVSNVVPLRTSEMEAPQMLRLFPVEAALFLLSAERGSASSSVSGDHGDGMTEDEDELDLDLTLG